MMKKWGFERGECSKNVGYGSGLLRDWDKVKWEMNKSERGSTKEPKKVIRAGVKTLWGRTLRVWVRAHRSRNAKFCTIIMFLHAISVKVRAHRTGCGRTQAEMPFLTCYQNDRKRTYSMVVRAYKILCDRTTLEKRFLWWNQFQFWILFWWGCKRTKGGAGAQVQNSEFSYKLLLNTNKPKKLIAQENIIKSKERKS